MQTEDLLNKARAGDNEALKDLSRFVNPTTAKLAYQAGIREENISQLQAMVIKKLLVSETRYSDNMLFHAISRALEEKQIETVEANDGSYLKFEEDKETHIVLQKLALTEKLSLILHQFHGKDSQEIADILGISVAEVESALLSARSGLQKALSLSDESDVQKRLDLLAKSYNRIVLPEGEEISPDAFQKMEENVQEPIKKEKSSANKKTIATLAGAGLFLSAVIGASFLFNEQPAETENTQAEEENPTTVTSAMVDRWETEYEEIRSAAPEKLGLSPETFEQLEYVHKADALKERTFSRQNVKQLKGDPERMQDQVDVLMLSIHTPKGMFDAVDDYRLLSSEISKFLLIYTEKTDQLITIADGLLEQHKEELAKAEVNGLLSPEKLTYSRTEYPEEIEKLTSALSEYTFQYTVHPNEDRFRAIRNINKFYEIHPFNSDMTSSQYVEIIRSSPYFDETGMLWPLEQLPYSVILMSTFLSDPMTDPMLKDKVEPQLIHTFFTMLKGDEHTEVFDSKGKVKEEFRMAWESLMQHNNNPVTFMMLPILEEFKESGWKKSAHYDQLAYPDLLYAIDLERKGELAEKLPNGDLEIESATLELEDYDYSDIEALYEEFSVSHDLNLLAGVEPMTTIKLYYYANKIEDIETMWHLTAEDQLKPSLEEYMKTWKKRDELTETMRNIDIFKENLHRQGRKVYLMAFGQPVNSSNNHQMGMDNITLVTEKDSIWLVQHQMNENYMKDENFEVYDREVRDFYNKLKESESVEALNLASPAEIAGVFLLALENEELALLRLMVHEMDSSISDEEFKDRWLNSELAVYSKMAGISFTADTYNIGYNGVRGGVNIWMDMDSPETSRYLHMEKVEDVWMVGDMFGF